MVSLLVFAGTVVGVASASDDHAPFASALAARLDRVADRAEARHAITAIERAREALRAAVSSDDPVVASRQLEIGHAAIELAERQLALRATRTALIETQRRITATRERAQAQRRVLEALLKERAVLARAGEER